MKHADFLYDGHAEYNETLVLYIIACHKHVPWQSGMLRIEFRY